MKTLGKIFKWIVLTFLAILALIAILFLIMSKRPFVPSHYTDRVATAGELESKYMAMGSYKVKKLQAEAPEDWEKFIIYYPEELESCDKKYPAVIFVNGTGVMASKYPALFKHLASWGFIVAGNEDTNTCSGDSASATLDYLIKQNNSDDSILCSKVDLTRIGISGHSQGGVGVFNAIKNQPDGEMYSCAVSLSPPDMELAEALNMHYAPSGTSIPTLVLAATENDVISLEGIEKIYNIIDGDKIMALRKNSNHGEMLYFADGYVTAWFMWHLQGDQTAAKAFIGEDAELLLNSDYVNQSSSLISK